MRRVIPLFVPLFSVGCGPVVFQSESKVEAARLKAKALCEAAMVYSSKSDGEQLGEVDDLTPFLDKGDQSLLDPWGAKYQFKTVEDDGRMRFVFWTTNPDTGQPLGWPRELAEQ